MCTVGDRIGWITIRSGAARRPGVPDTTTLVDYSAALARLAIHKVYSQRITNNLPVQYRDQLSLKERFYQDNKILLPLLS